MKYFSIFISVCLILALVYEFLRYLFNPIIHLVYVHTYDEIYLFFPALLASTIFFLLFILKKKSANKKSDNLPVIAWGIALVLTSISHLYFQFESHKIEIIIENLSDKTYDYIEVDARNNQHFEFRTLQPKGQIAYTCKCRNLDTESEKGIDIKLGRRKFTKTLNVLEKYFEFTDPSLSIKIISDTFLVHSSIINARGDTLWGKVGTQGGPLISDKDLKKFIQSK